MDEKINSLVIIMQKIATSLMATGAIDSSVLRSESPLQLSESGKYILEASGGRLYVDAHLPELLELLHARKLKSPLDVQNCCFITLDARSMDNDFVGIRNWVYEHPVTTITPGNFTLDLSTVARIMAIYLRNQYLESRFIGE